MAEPLGFELRLLLRCFWVEGEWCGTGVVSRVAKGVAFYSSGELGAVEGKGWPRHTAGGTVACVWCLSGARDGTGTCLVRARGGVAHARVVGRLGMVLVGRGDGGAGVPAGCSTECRPAVHRRLRAEGGALVRGVGIGSIRVAGGNSRTRWGAALLLVWNK